MRLIDADAYKREECLKCDGWCDICGNEKCLSCKDEHRCGFIKKLDNAPAVNAVEVVRCGECKYRYSGDTVFNVTTGEAKKLCQKLPYGTPTENLDFFCAYGERRADDDDL